MDSITFIALITTLFTIIGAISPIIIAFIQSKRDKPQEAKGFYVPNGYVLHHPRRQLSTLVVLLSALIGAVVGYLGASLVASKPKLETPAVTTTLSSAPVMPCAGRINTGTGNVMTLDIRVLDGEVAYAAGWGWDDQEGGIFVTITGPYEGTHKLNTGLYCPPMQADSETARETVSFLQKECNEAGGCPNTVLLP